MQHKNQFKQGHVLLEGVMLLGIIGILIALMLPTYAQCIKRAEESVCQVNCQQLQKLYETHLLIQDEVHSEGVFKDFLEAQFTVCCPDGSTIKYESGSVTCSKHDRDK